jgi:Asp/Glu/hydantoin racemase
VVGIFEASVYHSLSLLPSPDRRFAIVTTGKAWETLLLDGVGELLGARARCRSVESTGLDADQLHRVGEEELHKRLKEATMRALEGGEVEVVCLGCAGMVGLGGAVRAAAKEMGRTIRVVDGVEAGVGMLLGLLGRGYEV